MKNPYKKIVAVDFDGTLCKDAYPAIGDPLPYSIHYIKELAKDGAILILHTCRNGALLDAAVEWCNDRGIVFDYINENVPENVERYGGDTRKIYADIYVDTNAVNPRRTYGIGEFDENIHVFDAAEEIARFELCQTKCLCPEYRAAGMCCDCDVFLALRGYHALRIAEANAAADKQPAKNKGYYAKTDLKKCFPKNPPDGVPSIPIGYAADKFSKKELPPKHKPTDPSAGGA